MKPEPKVCDLLGALSRMGGDRPLLKKLVELFQEDGPVYLARLQAAVEEEYAAGLQHAAHSLNGLVANFGAQAASAAALRLEEMGRNGDVSAAAEAMETLEQEIVRLQTSLARELKDL